MIRLLLLGAALCTTACVSKNGGDVPDAASDPLIADALATLADANGVARATATLHQDAAGLTVRIEARAMTQGAYGVHVHTVGRCDAPAFTTAGGHWNPAGRQHGRENPQGAHLGDLPNLIVGTNGRGSVTFAIAGARLSGGATPLQDADGAAVIVHAAADDYRTDPSGNSGARIACGVVKSAR